MSPVFFADRADAGRRLVPSLRRLRGEDPLVVGLPRGGVPVAAVVAAALDAPLDVCLVRKLGAPFQPQLAVGAIGEGGVRVLDDVAVRELEIEDEEIAEVEQREQAALTEMAERYRPFSRPVDVAGRTVIVVDDGLATGATARAACLVLRRRQAGRLVVAVPVAPRGWDAVLSDCADELVAAYVPRVFVSVSRHYVRFPDVTDDQVAGYLSDADPRNRLNSW